MFSLGDDNEYDDEYDNDYDNEYDNEYENVYDNGYGGAWYDSECEDDVEDHVCSQGGCGQGSCPYMGCDQGCSFQGRFRMLRELEVEMTEYEDESSSESHAASLKHFPLYYGPGWYTPREYPAITAESQVPIFKSTKSDVLWGMLEPGDSVLPRGGIHMVDGYAMIALEGGGAVQATLCRASVESDGLARIVGKDGSLEGARPDIKVIYIDDKLPGADNGEDKGNGDYEVGRHKKK
jgi:hypothetical protein